MLLSIIGPAGISDEYFAKSGQHTPLAGNTTEWEQPHLARMLADSVWEAGQLDFSPLAATVTAYNEVITVLTSINKEVIEPLHKVTCHRGMSGLFAECCDDQHNTLSDKTNTSQTHVAT